MPDPATDLTAELERMHSAFIAMARSFRDFASNGGKYLGPADCTDMARYFEGKSIYLGETLAHHANALRQVAPPPAAGRPRLVWTRGETV